MHLPKPCWAWVIVSLLAFSDALKTPSSNSQEALDLLEETANPGQALDLLEERKIEKKKWNWKEASEESKTEWAIVLKRYVMASMSVFELERFFGEALPSASGLGEQHEALDKARKKLARLQSNLEKAVLDQNTSDATAGDMQLNRKDNLLTVHEKRILAQEHKREQYGFFAIEASGQDVLEKATELLQALDASQAQPAKVQPSWSSIVASPSTPKPTYMSMLNETEAIVPNSTQSNTTALRGSQPPTVEMLFQKFQDASKTFHGDLGNFESMQSKATTNLLAVEESTP